MSVKFFVNGVPAEFDGPEEVPLLWVVREHLRLTGSKFGCGIGSAAPAPCMSTAPRYAHLRDAGDDGAGPAGHDHRGPLARRQPSGAEAWTSSTYRNAAIASPA